MTSVQDALQKVRHWLRPPAEPEPTKPKPWKMPLSMKPRAFVDTETTGLDSLQNEIIEVAFFLERHEDCWWPSDRWLRKLEALAMLAEPHSHFQHDETGLEFCARIRPQRIETAHPIALEVNGYTEEGWKSQPYLDATFAEVLVAILRNAIFIGHNVSFDHDMLTRACERVGVRPKFGYHKIDTVTLAFEHLEGATESLSLINVCPLLGITNEGAHSALADVQRCRAVYHKLARASDDNRRTWSSQ